ncbi:AbiV family abortive infection protein [Vibrio parahaemolyticus]|uniref:AbiV family abortive infection protein n=1 Tax=Vibrio parahaemolyticus TaxID=670 RepID=UPI001D160499|nr:AbiV family abortive infection protein [Vibrio parahaemolyticus]MCC3788916.1 AbiV family abortive infection protein [Vibrio parahaemolyticus]MCC3836534.1 AbiV family abortive infection protein [Vibrio parahaemolyticus]MCC3841118.1 AbiV family abortive infection protein [Vibrio parahaemolyticus]
MSKNLKQWKNTLNVSEIADGMNFAQQNANRLLSDAEKLFELESYPTAYSIAVLAIEEAGKISILRELAVARNGNDVKYAWKAYRTHTKKNAMYVFPHLVASGCAKLRDFGGIYSDKNDFPALLDDLKQVGFYTDCLGQKHWSVPSQVISKEAADDILRVARILCKYRTYTQKEIELWVKHIKPVWKSSMQEMQVALKAWFNDMLNEGLAKESDISFEEFVG